MDHFTLEDNPFEDAELATFGDLQSDRDQMLDEADAHADLKTNEQQAEAAFEKMIDEKSSDWFRLGTHHNHFTIMKLFI